MKCPIGILFCISMLIFIFSCTPEDNPQLTNEMENPLEQHPEYEGVQSAMLDYVEALYLVDSTRIEQSVDTTMRKIGYWYSKENEKYYDNLEMTYDQLVSLAAKWNSDGDEASKDSPKELIIYDINDKTASGKLVAEWA